MTNPKEITREEMVEAMARAIDPKAFAYTAFDSDQSAAIAADDQRVARAKARDCIAALNPLLERVAGGLEPFSEAARNAEISGQPPFMFVGADQYEAAASLHNQLRTLVNG